MSKKSRDKRHKRRKAGSDVNALDAAELPPILRRSLEGLEFLHALFVEAGGDETVAASLALKKIHDNLEEIEAMIEPFDGFDILECVRFSNSVLDPDSYKETEFEGSAEAIEIVALIVAARSFRLGTAPPEGGHRASPDAVIEELLRLLAEIRQLGSDHVFFRMRHEHGDGSDLYFRAALREIHLRMLTYEHMLRDTLVELFSEPTVVDRCEAHLGFSGNDVLAVFTAMLEKYQRGWNDRIATLAEFSEVTRLAMSQVAATGDVDTETREEGRRLWFNAWANYADPATSTVPELASATSLPEPRIEAIVAAYALQMPSRPAVDAVDDFFHGISDVRLHPLIRDTSGAISFVHNAVLLSSVRETIEELLKPTAGWGVYDKHRAAVVENAAIRYLSAMLPGATVRASFEYFVPNPDAAVAEARPGSYTKLVEGDGLLVIDDVAIVVEAKAGAISERTRMGDPTGLDRDLRKLIADASDQALRVRRCIEEDKGICMRDRSWLDLSGIREIYVVAVSLEDLANVTSITSELAAGGFIPTTQHPWIVSLHDLRIISELVDRPAEFLFYLRRRTEVRTTLVFLALDELDYFMAFLQGSLYAEPDPVVTERELPMFGKARVRELRRYKRQPIEIVDSRTDALDAWYFFDQGIRRSPAPKPTLRCESTLLRLVDSIATQGRPGWLRAGATLLDCDRATQQRFARSGQELLDMTASDGSFHTIAIPGGTRMSNSFVLVFASDPDEGEIDFTKQRLEVYASAKKHQLRVAMGYGILFTPDGGPDPVYSTYDNREYEPDADLDRIIEDLGLTVRRVNPPPRKSPSRGR